MNRGKSYEGYEVTMNNVRMTLNMYISVGITLVLVAAAIIMLHNINTFSSIWKECMGAFLQSIKTHDMALFNRVIKVVPKVIWLSKNIILGVCIALPPTFWAVIKFFKWRAESNRNSNYVRGAKFVPASYFFWRRMLMDKGMPIGNLRMLFKDETSHVFLIGKTRSGKSMTLKGAVHYLQSIGHKAMIYENKGDFIPRYYRPDKDFIYCPSDKRSLKWSIWNDIRTVMDIDQVVCWSLIPRSKEDNPYWSDSAREVLRAGLYYLYLKNRCGVSNAQIYEFFSSGSKNIAECIKQVPEGQQAYDMISDSESKQTQGTISTLHTHISCIRYIKDQDGDFSVREWIHKEDQGMLYLLNNAKTKDVLKPLLTLMLDIASQEILSMREDQNRRIYIVLDEFGTLHPMNSIVELLTRGGAMGASVMLGTQDIGQIDEKYGANIRKSIINSCSTKLYLSLDETDTKEYISALISDVDVSEVNDTNSMGMSSYRDGKSLTRAIRTRRLVLPSELDSMPNLTGILKMASMPYTRISIPIVNHPVVNDQVVLRHELYLEYLLQEIPPLKTAEKETSDEIIVPEVMDQPKASPGSHEIDLD